MRLQRVTLNYRVLHNRKLPGNNIIPPQGSKMTIAGRHFIQEENRYMEKMKVRELMVAADQFPKISVNASLYEALATLEKVQEAFLSAQSEQRILLVEDEQGQILGKISPIDLFRGLERNYAKVNIKESLSNFGFKYAWDAMQKDYNLWHSPFKDLCRKAGDVHVKDFINIPSESQSVDIDNNLSKCFHLFVINRHDTLFVRDGDRLVGMLLFADVYKKVSETMKSCYY
jgi:CBS domain-containing protein